MSMRDDFLENFYKEQDVPKNVKDSAKHLVNNPKFIEFMKWWMELQVQYADSLVSRDLKDEELVPAIRYLQGQKAETMLILTALREISTEDKEEKE